MYHGYGQLPAPTSPPGTPLPPSGSGLSPAPGSGLSPAPGAPPYGSGLSPAVMPPIGASWAYAPIVQKLMQGQQAVLFTTPLLQEEAWYELVVTHLVADGYFVPGNEGAAAGAIYALAQAYGYFSLPGTTAMYVAWQQLRQAQMLWWLQQAQTATSVYVSVAPPEAKRMGPEAIAVHSIKIPPQLLRSPTAAAPLSSTTLILAALAVAGGVAYVALV